MKLKKRAGLFSFLFALISISLVSASIYTWHIQYNPTPVNPTADVQYWNFDLFDVPSETMQNLKNRGVFVMCYFSAGSWEDWRPDQALFPESCKGNSNGWPGERWIDIRCPEVREIMKARIDLGVEKGCNGFDPDNIDAYGNNNGLGLTEQDAIDYYNFLADYAHSKGKKIGLKNALTIIDDVLANMDWAVNEQCYRYNECFYLNQVVNSGKPVFNIEYGGQSKANSICPKAIAAGFSSLIKKTSLNDFEIPCSDYIENICGDGILEVNEECDDGNQNNNDNCKNDCKLNICRDGFVYLGVEECDDGNQNSADECSNFCFLTHCGDNIVQILNGQGINEICDGNQNCIINGYNGIADCSLDCLILEQCISNEYCGDFIINGNEECDDGVFGSDLCNSQCQLIFSEIAFDGFENGWGGGKGWIGDWWHEGDSALVTGDSPYEGRYHLRLRKGNGYIDRMLDLSDYETAKLGFYAKVKSFEASDFAEFSVSGDGINWTVLKTFTPADSDNVYHYYEYDLTPYIGSKVWISIDAQMSATNDYLYVDDVKIFSN